AHPWIQGIYHRAMRACEPFSTKSASQRTVAEKITYAFWYWLILRALLNFIGLRRARIALAGAAPIPGEIVRYLRTMGLPLVEVYGLTESTGMILGQHPDRFHEGTVGEPILGLEYCLGEADELLVRGDMVFAGYYKDPAQTDKVLQDGWLKTGDV